MAIKTGVSEGYINHNGKIVIPAKFSQASNFSDGLAIVCSDKCFYIDRSGSLVLKKFWPFWSFSDGLTVAGFRDRHMYIDKNGRVIAPYAIN